MSFAARQFNLDSDYQPDDVSPGSLTPNPNVEEQNGAQQPETNDHGQNGSVSDHKANLNSALFDDGTSQGAHHAHFSASLAPQGAHHSKKIAVLTSGGDSAGMNAAGESAKPSSERPTWGECRTCADNAVRAVVRYGIAR